MKAQPSWGSAASAYQGIFGCDKVIRKGDRAVSSLTRAGNWEAGRIAEALQQDTQLPFSGSLICTMLGKECPQPMSRSSMVTGPLHLSGVPMPMTLAQIAYGLPSTQPRLSSFKAVDEKQLGEAEAWGVWTASRAQWSHPSLASACE